MILQALNDYYQRRMADPDPARRLPAFGREMKQISFILELAADGTLKAISDVRRQVAKRLVGNAYLVPKGVKKTSGIAANLLWDNAEYVLRVPDTKKLAVAATKGKPEEYLERLVDMQKAFTAQVQALPEPAQSDAGIVAVLAFLSGDTLAAASGLANMAEIEASNPVLSFRLLGDDDLVCQRPAVAACSVAADSDDDNAAADGDPPSETPTAAATPAAHCLVTGQSAPAERLHTAIKGVWGAQTSGANIVSFNLDAFNSWGKTQGANAPVSRAAAFAYTTALNALLVNGSAQRMQVGDASTVFWAQKPDEMEPWLAQIMGGDDPDAHTAQVRALFDAVHKGGFDGGRGENKFFVLGLAPNAARIAIRFWHQAPLAEVAQRIVAWFDDLRIARAPHDAEFPSLFRLLTAVVVQGKADNIPPKLGGDIVRAMLSGGPLPATWLNAAIQRCRAEQQVNHLRAAAIKACLNRARSDYHSNPLNPPPREITEMLDRDNPSPGYRLGRLFATLERIQQEASPGLNATIRERYYGAASSTPVAVFTTLLRLKNHHLAKFGNRGQVVNLERLIGEIMAGLGDFPVHLPLPEQGRFAIGYYHQRQDFFTKREPEPGTALVIQPDAATTAETTTPGGN